jgi:hypothetical protein
MRTIVAIVAAAALAAPAAASADFIEIGQVAPAPKPSCPARPCLAVSRTTGYQVGPNPNLMAVPRKGRLVAWSVSLGSPGKRQVDFFNSRLGGEAAAQITVLGKRTKQGTRKVKGQGNAQKLAPFFGTSPQFALDQSIVVHKGWVVALTVPTWAPALAVGLDRKTSWRASRAQGKCNDTSSQTAQTGTGTVGNYFCLYRTARLAYSATLLPDPTPAPSAGQ